MDHPDVVVRRLGNVVSDGTHDGRVVVYRDDLPLESGVAGFVAGLQPTIDDLIMPTPRLFPRFSEVLGVVSEQGADVIRLVRLPGSPIGLDPSGNGFPAHVLGHATGLHPGTDKEKGPVDVSSPVKICG